MAVLMYAILFVAAPAIARFYKIPLLSNVLRVQGLVLFIYAFNIVQRNQLRKKLNFKVLSIVTVSTSFIALCITIAMAYKGFGVWSLVAQNLITAAIPAIVFWFYIKWRPIWTFSWKSFKELFGFGFYMFLTSILNTLGQQIQGLLIGKVYNPTTMGYYSKAHGFETLASNSVSSIMTQVTYPLFAEVQDDKLRMINMIKRITMTLSYFTFPIMFILILLANPIFVLLFSEKWLPSVPYFQVLCLAGLANCLMSVNLQTISAIGKSKAMFIWTVVKRTVGISAIVVGLLLFGMKGLLGGVIINNYFSYLVNIGLVSKYVGYKWIRQLLDILPVTLASVIAAAFSLGVGYLFDLNMYPDAVVKLVVYLIVYFGWSILFKPEAYTYSMSIIPARFRFWEKRK